MLRRNVTTGQTGAWLLDAVTNQPAVVGWARTLTEPPNSGWQIPGVGDFTGDGKPDVLWRNTGTGQTGAWIMNGTAVSGRVWMPTESPASGWQIEGPR